jgi:DNA-directed RNA polymerase subunit RPC12/RpoP
MTDVVERTEWRCQSCRQTFLFDTGTPNFCPYCRVASPHKLRTAGFCPKCGTECMRDDVDVVAGILYGPWGCPGCGWSEDSQ